MIQTVKLAKLRLSPINVRTAPEKDLAIEPMAADIEARGVLQNLLVTPARPRGTFEVFDGGRRLRGLLLLAERGTIDADSFDVPVLVLKDSDAALSETSLAANFHQLKLSPAEECRAFQHFLGVDGDVDAVAKRFGQTRRFIEQRLRLANLADPIFDALAAGELTLDLAKAYASTENREKQLLIYNSYSHHSYINADAIRRAIANETMKANDPVALLVGETDCPEPAVRDRGLADLYPHLRSAIDVGCIYPNLPGDHSRCPAGRTRLYEGLVAIATGL